MPAILSAWLGNWNWWWYQHQVRVSIHSCS